MKIMIQYHQKYYQKSMKPKLSINSRTNSNQMIYKIILARHADCYLQNRIEYAKQ